MKVLVFLMIMFSTITGATGNLGFISLYNIEFIGPIAILKSGNYNLSTLVLWIVLVLSHLALISLIFLTKSNYFKALLVWVPLMFLVIFIVFIFWSFFLLTPFIIVWLIALFKQSRKEVKLKLSI
ncbi:hypothetical protein [Mucilaginibacter sp.]|uniref:hypothetical protein n=1 Tax=Mucilaginibacter sp. TaxID=1882438 RepID=UPI003B00AA10